jgi:hypothetical protein
MDTFCSTDVKELAGAMLKVQAEINPAIKDAANPFAKSRYATLNSVILASREALLKHGVWVTQYPIEVEVGQLGLVTKLTHATSGQFQSCLLVMPLAKQDPQGYGSAMTYARRYSMASMIGLIVEDDDGETACGRPKSANTTPISNPNPKSNGNGNGNAKAIGTGNGSDNGNMNNVTVITKTESSADNPATTSVNTNSLANLPQLEGISYENVTAHDGQTCIIASGDTIKQKEILKSIGFKWNVNRKIWWRYAEASSIH